MDRTDHRVLSDRLFRVVQVVWWLLLPLAAATPITSAVLLHRNVALETTGWAAAGFELNAVDPSLLPFTPEAERAGVDALSTVVSVAGRPVATTEQARAAAAAIPAGAPLAFRIRDPSGAERNLVVQRSPAALESFRRRVGVSYAAHLWIEFALEQVLNLAWLVVAVALFRIRARDAVPAALSLGALGLVGSTLLDDLATAFGGGFGALEAVVTSGAVLAMSWGLMAFPSGHLERRWLRIALGLVAALCALATAVGLAGGEGELVSAPALFLAFTIAAAAVWSRWRRAPAGVVRQQIKWAAAGLAAGSLMPIVGLVGYVVIGASGAGPAVEVWGEVAAGALVFLGVSAVMLGLLVALVRYRLYDADALIGRSTAIAGLATLAVVAWASLETVLKSLLSDVVGSDNGPALAAILATLGALVVAPARKRLSRLTEKRFQPGLAALRDDVPERLRDLKHSASPAEIAQSAVQDVASALRSTQAALVSGDRVQASFGLSSPEAADWAHAGGAALVQVPVPAAGGLAPRMLLLGPRPDGSLPGPDDRKAVAGLAPELGRALDAATIREARDARLTNEIDVLKRQVAAMAARGGPG